MDHKGHLVYWTAAESQGYRLYCLTCGKFTAHETTIPNTHEAQRFEQAISKPENISVTLQVQSLRHKRTQEIR